MATSVSFIDSKGSSLTEDEKKHARMMFKYCSQDQSPFLTRAQLQRAVEFFIAQYEGNIACGIDMDQSIEKNINVFKLNSILGIQDTTKKSVSLMLSEIFNDQTTFPQFIHMIQLIKSYNQGFRSKPEIQLDKKYILAHLSKKQIFHIDTCWGSLDKMKLGYLQKTTIKECIDLVLQKYDLSGMNIRSSSQKKASFNSFNNYVSQRNMQPQDSILKGSLKFEHRRQSSVGEGSLLPTNQNTQSYSPSSQQIVRRNINNLNIHQQEPSVGFTNSPSTRTNVPNEIAPAGNHSHPPAIKHANSMGQISASEISPFRSRSMKRASTSKSSNFSEQYRSFERKNNIFSKGDPCQLQKVAQWLDKIEVERLVPFEEFANFISQLIVENKLQFSQKAQCQCSIF